jgi:hypothetical protein
MYLSRLQTRLKNINKYKGALIIKKNIDVEELQEICSFYQFILYILS